MIQIVADVISGVAFLIECHLVFKWVRSNWWLIKGVTQGRIENLSRKRLTRPS